MGQRTSNVTLMRRQCQSSGDRRSGTGRTAGTRVRSAEGWGQRLEVHVPPLLQLKGGADPAPQPQPAAQGRPAPGLPSAPLGLLASPEAWLQWLCPCSRPLLTSSCPSTTSSPLRHPVRAKGTSSPALWCTTTACSRWPRQPPLPALGSCFTSEPQFRHMLLKGRLPTAPPGL